MTTGNAHIDLRVAAHRAMMANGFLADMPADVLAEAAHAADPANGADVFLDLRALPWSSIDNDKSVDLDQLEVAETLANGDIRVRVAIADVSGTVKKDSATDQFAHANSTSVYTGVITFPMLPERLSTQLTSLGENNERPAVVIEFTVTESGETHTPTVYLARVENRAKLAYSSVGAWLDGHGSLPNSANKDIQQQLRLQDTAALRLRADRTKRGALRFETIEAQSVLHDDQSVSIELVQKTRASHLIEDFMVTANVTMAQFLDAHGSPSIRRVVRTPERWDRIVALAGKLGETLPAIPDAVQLAKFLEKRRQVAPDTFADLSLSVVKLLGPGEYALHVPGADDAGHFGLATHDYTHSTAPNRRFADLVTQRLLKAVLGEGPAPYTNEELAQIAAHCTERESAARKVERLVRKEAAAVSMISRVGELFDAVVTGVTPKGTFARLIRPPVEGRVVQGESGLDVGDRVQVKLLSVDAEKGFIDFGAPGEHS